MFVMFASLAVVYLLTQAQRIYCSAGQALSNSDDIREAHNSFRSANPIVHEDREDDEKGDAFHFIAYLPIQGELYELDGLKPGPIRLGPCSQVIGSTRPSFQKIETRCVQNHKFYEF